jgi:cyclase
MFLWCPPNGLGRSAMDREKYAQADGGSQHDGAGQRMQPAARCPIGLRKLLVIPALAGNPRAGSGLQPDRRQEQEPARSSEDGQQQGGQREHPSDLRGGMHDGRKLWLPCGHRLVPQGGRTSRRPLEYGARSFPRRSAEMKRLSLAAVLAASAAFAQQQDFSKVEITATQVAGSVWMLKGSGGNIAVSVGDDGIVMIDDQFAPLVPKIKAALAKISQKPVRFLINTHWHSDHVGGNAAMAETAAILAHENVRKRMQVGGEMPAFNMKIEPAEPRALPVVTYQHDVTIWLNGEPVRALHVPPGHTDGDTVVFFTKSNVVHMGDDFVTYGFPFVDLDGGGSVRGMVGAIDELLPQIPPDAKIIPGHGPLSTVADLKKFRNRLDEIVALVARGLKSGKTVEQMQKEKLLAPYEDWNGGPLKADQFLAVVARDLKK